MERRGLLAKEEVVRSFAPVGQREKHTANYTQVIIAWTMREWGSSSEARVGNLNMPYSYCLCWGSGSWLLPEARSWVAQPISQCKHCASVEGRWRTMWWWGMRNVWLAVLAVMPVPGFPGIASTRMVGTAAECLQAHIHLQALGLGTEMQSMGFKEGFMCLKACKSNKKNKNQHMNYFPSTLTSSFIVPLLQLGISTIFTRSYTII